MATRVSKLGGSTRATSPQLKRLIKRASRDGISEGGLSALRMICFAVVIEGIEGVKELLLTVLAFLEELDIVNDQQIHGAKLALKIGQAPRLDGMDEAVDKILTTEQFDANGGMLGLGIMTNRMQNRWVFPRPELP